jgi:hypothetical protein
MQQAASNFESSVQSEMQKTEAELNKSVDELNRSVEAGLGDAPKNPSEIGAEPPKKPEETKAA